MPQTKIESRAGGAKQALAAASASTTVVATGLARPRVYVRVVTQGRAISKSHIRRFGNRRSL